MINGLVTAREEFLFPDAQLDKLPGSVRFACAKNEISSLQIIFATDKPDAKFALDAGAPFELEIYRLVAVPVEHNTGDGVEQGGAMVIDVDKCPPYAIRRAPFFVYDCLEYRADATVPAVNGRVSAYVCLKPRGDLPAGALNCTLTADTGAEKIALALEFKVYDVEIPEEKRFCVTNWYSEGAISKFHGTVRGTPEHAAMRAKYAQAMLRARQTHVFVNIPHDCLVRRKPYEFDFSGMEEIIRTFFDAGITGLELGSLLARSKNPDGSTDMHTGKFVCALDTGVDFESMDGYELTVSFVKALAQFLKARGWDKNLVFHIHDEPDVHVNDEATMHARRRQYYMAASIVRKYLPGVRIIEAVSSAYFAGGIDVWVPVTSGYEAHRADFSRMQALGEEVWTYVCCGPEGKYLNRFLDWALVKPRLLFWGCAEYGQSGYLHWGFNQFSQFDPFKGTSCPNDTGIGTNFPCGDAFIVYPGSDGPMLSMRLEAQRRGAQDVELLNMLKARSPEVAEEIISRVFRSNCDYCDDVDTFADNYEKLLMALAGK